MKGLCYMGTKGDIRLQDIPKPKILEPTDIIGKTVVTTICGSDLHVVDGALPFINETAKKTGRGVVLGHEGIVRVEEIGSAVKTVKPGDVVVVSCISSCGSCYNCKRGQTAHCLKCKDFAGWSKGCACILGAAMDGTQAEYVRVPLADSSVYKCPKGIPLESLLMLSDILPTSYELGVEGNVTEGSTVAVVGCGPIGLSAILSAKSENPKNIIAIDLDDSRLEVAKKLGANYIVNSGKQNVEEFIANNVKNGADDLPGVDTAIECCGLPVTLELCERLIGVGGTIANVGVHVKPATLFIDDLWIRNFKLTGGLVNTTSTRELLEKVKKGLLDPSKLVTHRFKMKDFIKAYEVFSHAAENKAIKMLIENDY